MRTGCFRRAAAVLLTAAAGSGLLLGGALLSALAQAATGQNIGLGVMAASKDGLTDCEGDSVYASPHTGTTAWYILAARRISPLSATTPIPAQ
jgi:hypothetical protein